MSKAFTRESDDAPEQPLAAHRPSPLPPGTKNYLTPDGAQRLQEEVDHLLQAERPRLAQASGEVGAQLQALDQRIAQLQQSLHLAVVVPPPAVPDEKVRFGATVTVREPDGKESRYRIVGVYETDMDRNWISWLSPIGKALVNARLGQRVRFRVPAGEQEWLIAGITYEDTRATN